MERLSIDSVFPNNNLINPCAINYQETIAWLFDQLPMYQRVGQAAYKADLEATLHLAQYLNNPQKSFKSVHVAGTNGKGSVCHMLASVFQEAGYKTGLYTSPHLKDFRERIKINGEMIPQETVSGFVGRHKEYFEKNRLSFFEMTVGMAFDYFENQQVDIAIVEVGMGGRLDSTNIINPDLSVITNIGLDHTRFLGDTLEKIAFEKAGIIKENVPVVIGEALPETQAVFEQIGRHKNAAIYIAEDQMPSELESDLKGPFQNKNIQTVTVAVDLLRENGWNIPQESLRAGLLNTIANTGLMGRWQVLNQHPKVICDTAHNREGLLGVLEQVQNEKFDRLHVVLGMVADKNLDMVLPLFPKDATYYFCKPSIPRGLDASLLAVRALEQGLNGEEFISVPSAYKAALRNASKEDLVFVGGSTFVVAEVL